MHGPRWGTREQEMERDLKYYIEETHTLRYELYVMQWLLAEALHCPQLVIRIPEPAAT